MIFSKEDPFGRESIAEDNFLSLGEMMQRIIYSIVEDLNIDAEDHFPFGRDHAEDYCLNCGWWERGCGGSFSERERVWRKIIHTFWEG